MVLQRRTNQKINMTESEKTIRLSKVTRELNIGLQTIVEFLSAKGIQVEYNSNAKISEQAYKLLYQEFQSEKSAKEEAQMLQSTKFRKDTPGFDKPVEKPDLQESFSKGADIFKKQEKAPEEKKEVNIFKAAPEQIQGPTVLGKIDIDALNPKKKAEPKKEEPQPVAVVPEPEEIKVVEEPQAVVTPEPVHVEDVEENDEVVEEEIADTEEESKDESPSGDNKDEIYRTNVQKLTGPTVLGKIDLPLEQPKRKPVASSSSFDVNRDKKKKRKRTDKKGATGTAPAQGDKPAERPAGQGFQGQRPGAPGQGFKNKFQKPDNRNADPKQELDDKQIQEQIKNTLARLSGAGKSKGSKYRKAKREANQEAEAQLENESQKKVVKVTEFVSANELAKMMNVSVTEIISTCMSLGMFVSINQRLDAETLTVVAEEFGYSVEFVSADVQESIGGDDEDSEEDLVPRAPIVTVMGHVDHGKTSLLDHIRKANVIAGEAGGITQHIGAYEVRLENGKKITFLDTPGHEAFTAMRARGAKITDVAIIVVAADDSVMPQTVEAINHAQAAGVPLVFAINKVDKPGANPDKIKEQLANMNFLVEDWGGKYQSQEISAKQGLNIDKLLEKVLLEAEILDLKANPKKRATGTVVESSLDKGRGYISTVLVQTGTLHVGDVLLAGRHSGKVKAMFNERGGRVNEAGPSTPVLILGLDGAPQAGDKFNVMDDEREARDIANKRMQLQREQGIRTHKHITLAEIGRRLAIGNFKELNIIIKGDVDGSIEALSDSLLKLSTEEVQINVIHKSVGQISESDVLLASASNAIIIGFQVRPSAAARKVAEQEEIDIRLYSIIYDAINEVKAAMEGMLAPEFEEKIVANIEVRETFKIPKVGTIAGCMVLEGKITRNTKIRLIREGIVVFSGELASLKRYKDDVKEVSAGYECGLNILNFNDLKVGDIIEGYDQVPVKRTL